MVRYPNERSNGGRLTRAMEGFSDFVRIPFLINLPLFGGEFNWLSNRDSLIFIKD